MPFRDPRSRLVDIADAIGWLHEVLRGKQLADYRGDRALRDIAERNHEKCSEASRHLPPEMKAAHLLIPWPQIAALGNRLRHGDDAIAHRCIDRSKVTRGADAPCAKARVGMLEQAVMKFELQRTARHQRPQRMQPCFARSAVVESQFFQNGLRLGIAALHQYSLRQVAVKNVRAA